MASSFIDIGVNVNVTHCGVGGGMAHLVEVARRLRGEAGDRGVAGPARVGLVHADGGVMSAHVGVVLEAAGDP